MLSIRLHPNRIIRISWKGIIANLVFRIQKSCRLASNLVAQVTKLPNRLAEVESTMRLTNSAPCCLARRTVFQRRLPSKKQSSTSNLWRNSLRRPELSLERKTDWVYLAFHCLYLLWYFPVLQSANWGQEVLFPWWWWRVCLFVCNFGTVVDGWVSGEVEDDEACLSDGELWVRHILLCVDVIAASRCNTYVEYSTSGDSFWISNVP